jgi:hypothetical protein
MASDALRLLFELDVDSRAGTAGLLRFRKDIAATIQATRRAVAQSITPPSIKLPTTTPATGGRGSQADAHVKEFRRIESEAKKSARAQEAEQRRLNRAVESLQRQRSAAIIAGFKAEERAAVASSRAQARAARQAAQSISNAFRGIGPGLQSIGRTLTVGITAPLLALGAASVKSAKDLDANVNTLKAFTGSAEAAERRLAELIKTARDTPGLTTNLALTLDAQLRVAQTTQETIDRVLPAIGRLNAVSKLPDAARFTQNLLQLVTQNFERQDLKELVGQSPLAGQLITEIFQVDSPTNAAAIRAAAQKMGLTTTEAFFAAFAEAAQRNQGLATVTESIGTRFEKVVDRVSVALRPLGLAIINAIEPFIEPIAKLVERIGAAFDSLSQPVKTAIIVITGIAAAAGPVLFILGGLATAITGVITAIGAIGAAVAAIGLPALAAVIAGFVIVIAEWAAILGVLGLAWKTNFLNIRGLVTDAATTVLEAFNRIRVVIEEVVQRVLPTLQSITAKVLGVITALWERYGATIVSVISTSFEIIVRTLETFTRFFGNVVDLIAKIIDSDWQGAWNAFSRIIINALDGLTTFFDKAGPIVAQGFKTLHAFIIRQAVIFVQAGSELAAKLIASIATEIVAGAPKIVAALSTMLVTAAAGVAATPIGVTLVQRLLAAMRKAASEAPPIPIKVELQNVGGEPVIGAGVLRKKGTKPSSDDSTKRADTAARRRIRILELEAEKIRTLTDAQLAREQIAFDERKKSLEDYTNLQIQAAGDVLLAQLRIYKQEREEANKIRNQSARDLALAEIGNKEFEAQQAFTTKVAQLEANKRKEEFDAQRAHREALLDLQDEGDRKRLQLIDSYVERYLLSYEDAEKRRIQIEEDARQRRKAELGTQLGEAGLNVQEQQRINDAIDKINAESATAREEAESRKRAALRATVEAETQYYQTLQAITLRVAQLLRDAADIELGGLIRKFGDRRKFRLEILRLERQANEEQHQENLRQIEQEKRDAEKRLEGVRDAEEKLLALREYYAGLDKAERKRRAVERRDEEAREAEERDPFSPLRKRLENFRFEIENINNSIAESIGTLAQQVNESISAMTDALRQGIVAYVLYGDSIGKALKAALAQQLAAISAEAAIQSLKHAAYAIGSAAFGNFAAAAKHTAAALAFAGLALATGFAGRSLAKSSGLFDRGRSSSTASAAVNGGENEPHNREFQGGQGAQPSSVAAREGSGGLLGRREANEQALVQALNNHTAATLQLKAEISRLKTQPKGVVVADGLEENPAAAGTAVLVHSNSSGDFNETLQRNLGFAR